MKDPLQLDHFNTIRGLAAVAVMGGHLRALTLLDAAKVPLSAPWKLFYFLTGFGRESVMVFFVLSGFFISRSIVQGMEKGRWTWRDYLVSRLSRLWLVLVPALGFTWLVDRLGLRLAAADGIYNPAVPHGVNVFNSVMSLDWKTFFGNVAFLQTIWVPHFGSNDPLWSLSNEFWYYILFPLLAALGYRMFSGKMKIASAALALALMATFLRPMLLLFAVWLMGYALFLASRNDGVMRLASRGWFRTAMGAGFLLVLTLSRVRFITDRVADVAVGLAATLFLLSLLGCGQRPQPVYRRVAQALSDLSYPLYAFHLPLCIFILGVGLHSERLRPSAGALGVYAAGFMTMLAVAFVAHLAFQRHTDAVRKAVGRFFQPKPAPAQATS